MAAKPGSTKGLARIIGSQSARKWELEEILLKKVGDRKAGKKVFEVLFLEETLYAAEVVDSAVLRVKVDSAKSLRVNQTHPVLAGGMAVVQESYDLIPIAHLSCKSEQLEWSFGKQNLGSGVNS